MNKSKKVNVEELVSSRSWTKMLEALPVDVTTTVALDSPRDIDSLRSVAYRINVRNTDKRKYGVVTHYANNTVTITVKENYHE